MVVGYVGVCIPHMYHSSRSSRFRQPLRKNNDSSKRNSIMRKAIALEFITLDGVIQAGGGPWWGFEGEADARRDEWVSYVMT